MEDDASDPAVLAANLRLLIARLARRLRQAAALEPHDLTPSRLAALASLARMGPRTLGELAAIEGVQSPTMTRIVASLEAAGTVERFEDEADRRVAKLAVTDKGTRLLEEVRSGESAHLARRLAEMEEEERVQITRVIPTLEKLLRDA